MTPFTILTARACALPRANVDTDQLIPARFMKRSRAEGYGAVLLHDLRFRPDGTPDPGFPLNAPGMDQARILIARRNFGAGSSREAAVYALADYGIRCIVAPSFGDIFAANAANNGLLPATVVDADAERLLAVASASAAPIAVDLRNCTIASGDLAIPFTIDPVRRTKLLNGWDDLAMTESFRPLIGRFAAADAALRPWVRPRSAG